MTILRCSDGGRSRVRSSSGVAAPVCPTTAAGAVEAAPSSASCKPELPRNIDVLKQQPVPAYYAAYTLHDSRRTQILASFGAIDRSDENRQRFATVEVRVGDYQLDNTHPIRGDARAMSPRLVQVSLPLTDDEKPIRLALWRATDRSYKQASEALTRVRTNVAAKVQDENPAPDFSREEKQDHAEGPASYSLDTRGVGSAAAACVGGLQRRPAGAAQPGVADGRRRQPLLHQQRGLADCHGRRQRAASSFRA